MMDTKDLPAPSEARQRAEDLSQQREQAALARRRAAQAQEEVIKLIMTEAYSDKESTLTDVERETVQLIKVVPRRHAMLTGVVCGATAATALRFFSPQQFKRRGPFWFWVSMPFIVGFQRGAQMGSKKVMTQILNMPDSQFAEQIKTHLRTHSPQSAWLELVKENPAGVHVMADIDDDTAWVTQQQEQQVPRPLLLPSPPRPSPVTGSVAREGRDDADAKSDSESQHERDVGVHPQAWSGAFGGVFGSTVDTLNEDAARGQDTIEGQNAVEPTKHVRRSRGRREEEAHAAPNPDMMREEDGARRHGWGRHRRRRRQGEEEKQSSKHSPSSHDTDDGSEHVEDVLSHRDYV